MLLKRKRERNASFPTHIHIPVHREKRGENLMVASLSSNGSSLTFQRSFLYVNIVYRRKKNRSHPTLSLLSRILHRHGKSLSNQPTYPFVASNQNQRSFSFFHTLFFTDDDIRYYTLSDTKSSIPSFLGHQHVHKEKRTAKFSPFQTYS